MRIQFYTPLDHVRPISRVIDEMPATPRVGEEIMFEFDGYEYVVRKVCWTPHEEDYDVYVRVA